MGFEPVDSAILWLLGASGVLAVALFVIKGLLDQVPDIAESWHRAKHAVRGQDRSDGDDS
ncbi:hypothetical protein TPA0598_04_03600 [Streptomyces lydicamycinicus]|uniref:Uncharacterized protein n=1 Tax=Streptomyces lydicamycinicus TaxID=1546107 RepID=A0A0P4R6G3_9ACTN|nr:hypothetical protein TPA0598_04_03600 [Streptomyces lydicamycinicus]